MLNSGQCPLYVVAAGRKVVLPGRGTRALTLNGRSLTFLELREVSSSSFRLLKLLIPRD